MALYLGNRKIKLHLHSAACYLRIFTQGTNVFSGGLLSSDGYLLKDTNGIYLMPKEGE